MQLITDNDISQKRDRSGRSIVLYMTIFRDDKDCVKIEMLKTIFFFKILFGKNALFWFLVSKCFGGLTLSLL